MTARSPRNHALAGAAVHTDRRQTRTNESANPTVAPAGGEVASRHQTSSTGELPWTTI